MKGIDVSAWQDSINWQGLKDDGCEFVIVKIGQSYKLTETFLKQIREAEENGMKLGVYYYSKATSIEEAQQEADWVDQQLQQYVGVKNPEIGIWYDMEDPSIRSSGADITALCSAFVSTLNERGYTYVGIYSSYNWLTSVIDAYSLADYVPYWVAQYNSQDDFSLEYPTKQVKIWQYTDHVSDDLPYDGNISY